VEVGALLADGRRHDAVRRFHEAIGVPDEILEAMAGTPEWARMVALAPTLAYDCALADATDRALLERVSVATLVLDSSGSDDVLTGWAAEVAARLPNATHRSLPGEWHAVADDDLAAVLVPFLRGGPG
jgi:hypothetical protein